MFCIVFVQEKALKLVKLMKTKDLIAKKLRREKALERIF